MQKLGTVISTGNTPNTEKFYFVLSENSIAKKGQFVVVKTEEGKLISRISDIIKVNPYFERADSVKEFERSGKSLSELFPSERWEYLLGEAVPLGIYEEKVIKRSFVPPSPGENVYLAEKEALFDFFGFDENGLNLGKIQHHDVEAKINLTRLLQKHLAILAMSGAGKSYFTTVLIEELLRRKKELGKINIVLVDVHGEYGGFAEDQNFMNDVKVINGSDFRISIPSLSPEDIFSFVPNLSGPQKRELKKVFALVHEENKNRPFTFREILEKIEDKDIIKKSETRNILYNVISELNATGIFGIHDNPSVSDLSKQGKLFIIDISDLVEMRQKQIIVTYLANKLFKLRRYDMIPPTAFVVEEAHNFAPENASKEYAISRGIIEKIAREGRKFHLSLVLISQRPVNLSTTALSQCNTHIVLRVSNPYDLDHIGKTSEGITRDVLKTITSLQVGEALIVGEAVNYPLFIKVRKRLSVKSEKGVPLEQAAIEYAKKHEQNKKDAESFL